MKVSVIIATFQTGEPLEDLVASLDRQSLPTSEWEAIFVDDGSRDDTFQRLTDFARSRPHFRVERIENSGWPCRPRNTGMDLAQGEYVGFMDHDDLLFPDALKGAYEYAKANGSDALNAKEARTDDAGWSAEQFAADEAQLLGRRSPYGALSPSNPHKLYRRDFLKQHDIRFREGGRVLWEDIFFNIQVLANARVISTLAHTPYYHWRTTAGSGSTTFRRAKSEWWHWLNEVIVAIDEDLGAEGLAEERRALRHHQYRARLLESFNNYYSERVPAARKTIFEHARRLQQDHFDVTEDDASLNVSERLRAKVLRAGYPHVMDRLVLDDPLLRPDARSLTGPRWEDGTLHLDIESEWVTPTGASPAVRSRGDVFYKQLPGAYDRVFVEEELDVTDEINTTTVQVTVQSRATRIGWVAQTSTRPWLERTPAVRFGARGAAHIDPRTTALGAPLEEGQWELSVRCTLAGTHHQAVLSSIASPALRFSQTDGLYAAYPDQHGVLVLDLAPSPSTIAQLLRPTGRTFLHGTRVRVEVEVSELDGSPALDIALKVRAARTMRSFSWLTRTEASHEDSGWRSVPALLTADDGKAWLEFDAAGVDFIQLAGQRSDENGIYHLAADASLRATRPRRGR